MHAWACPGLRCVQVRLATPIQVWFTPLWPSLLVHLGVSPSTPRTPWEHPEQPQNTLRTPRTPTEYPAHLENTQNTQMCAQNTSRTPGVSSRTPRTPGVLSRTPRTPRCVPRTPPEHPACAQNTQNTQMCAFEQCLWLACNLHLFCSFFSKWTLVVIFCKWFYQHAPLGSCVSIRFSRFYSCHIDLVVTVVSGHFIIFSLATLTLSPLLFLVFYPFSDTCASLIFVSFKITMQFCFFVAL